MSKIVLYVNNNTGYQCNNQIGFIKYDEVSKEFTAHDNRSYLKGRTVCDMTTIMSYKNERYKRDKNKESYKGLKFLSKELSSEFKSEMGLLYGSDKRLFFTIDKINSKAKVIHLNNL